MTEYYANLFKVTKTEPIKIKIYNVNVKPIPEKRPLFYNILGILAKKLSYKLRSPIISDEGKIKVVGNLLNTDLLYNIVTIPNIGEYEVQLSYSEDREVYIKDFNEYRQLINRIIDISLVYFTEDYYKYHPYAPNIIKYEHVFDNNLIENTGIIDYKKYYRNLRIFNEEHYLILDRETIIQSYKNMLNEMKCLLKHFTNIRNKSDNYYNFYDPPSDFISYINSIFRGKSANVLAYPGPSIKNIKRVTWEYRGGDVAPGQSISTCDYLEKFYGIKNLDKNQPLIEYILETPQGVFTQYHLPEVLSVGHDFKDLEKIIPPWQRQQVWDYINPNCKNQLREILNLVKQIDASLRLNMTDVYPSKIEISILPVEISPFIIGPQNIDISFLNKELSLEPPYNENFYKLYGKSLRFVNPVPNDIRALVHLEKKTPQILEFFEELKNEFNRRNKKDLIIEYDYINFEEKNYINYDLVMTLSESDDLYVMCKIKIQNEDGIIHQNIRPENATPSSIIPLTMQLTLMFGGDPWLLNNSDEELSFVGVHFYRSPFSGNQRYFYNILNGAGKLLYQSDPYSSDNLNDFLIDLIEKLGQKERVIILMSFNQLDFQDKLCSDLDAINELEYMILLIKHWDNLRIFNTWKPVFIERRRRRSTRAIKYPFESYENAPQGIILDAGNNVMYIITSRSIRRETGFRGCPHPIRVEMVSYKGEFEIHEVLSNILSLSMMSRISGHSTRLPSPLNYLQKYAYYIEKFGEPLKNNIKQSLFYL